MCTVSVVPHRDGLRVMANRDERLDRAAALPPAIHTCGSRAATMPIDPEGGGSWIGVNDAGLVAAMLNRSPERRALHHCGSDGGRAFQASRGSIVPIALRCESLTDAVESVCRLDATQYRPFRLVLVQNDRIALIAGNTREPVHAAGTLDGPCMFTSSSLGDVLVETPRRRLFEWLMNDADDRVCGQALFHRHQ